MVGSDEVWVSPVRHGGGRRKGARDAAVGRSLFDGWPL